LGTENSFEVLSEVNQLKNEGKDIVNFCIGPDIIYKKAAKERTDRDAAQAGNAVRGLLEQTYSDQSLIGKGDYHGTVFGQGGAYRQ